MLFTYSHQLTFHLLINHTHTIHLSPQLSVFITPPSTVTLNTPKHRNLIREPSHIIREFRNINPIQRDHVTRPNGMQIIQIHLRVLDRENAALARRSTALVQAIGAPVVEEFVEPSAINQDFLRVNDAQAPAIGVGDVGAVAVDVLGGGEDGVTEGGIAGERDGGVGIGLVVGDFDLDLAHDDVGGVLELVLVHVEVFDCGACFCLRSVDGLDYYTAWLLMRTIEPHVSVPGLDQHAAASVYGDLVIAAIKVVIGSP